MAGTKGTIFFSYIQSPTFSGQSAASDLIVRTLDLRGWNCTFIPLYALRRGIRNAAKRYSIFFAQQLISFSRLLSIAFRPSPILHLSLGQSYGSFLRVGLWFFPLCAVRRDIKVVISLNGSVFTSWAAGTFILSVFLAFLKRAQIVTVVGAKHREKLIDFGLPTGKVRVVGNPCTLSSMVQADIVTKHDHAQRTKTVNLLHLSLLIESKGFPEYLEAIEILAGTPLDFSINAVLCGPMSFTSYCNRFDTIEKKESWISSKIATINSRSEAVNVTWIRGAKGAEKQKLFQQAHIFILPTTFPVEAQPLVLLEALASGSAVITSKAGEIPSTLDDSSARMLDDLSPQNLAREISLLINEPQIRKDLSLNGSKLVADKFSLDHYADTWENIFYELRKS